MGSDSRHPCTVSDFGFPLVMQCQGPLSCYNYISVEASRVCNVNSRGEINTCMKLAIDQGLAKRNGTKTAFWISSAGGR